MILDENFRYLRWNKNLETVTGYDSKRLSSAHAVEDFFEDETSKRAAYAILNEMFEKGSASGDVSPILPNQHRTYHVTGRRIMYEGKPCLLCLGSDITERKKIEAQWSGKKSWQISCLIVSPALPR
jgi:PAS domain S-box-containing protein